MARSCNFDRQEKLIQAMELFWRKGFAETSIADLVEHLGINRFSLYNSFGDKQSLYRESLRFYLDHYSFGAKEQILHEQAGLSEILTYLTRFVALQREQEYGCFMQNAVMEKCLDDDCVQQECQRLFTQLQTNFTDVLRYSQLQGELPQSVQPESLAAFLVLQLQGIRVLGKAKEYALLDNAFKVLSEYLKSLALTPLKPVDVK
ncbi:TetR/AcrR family transcriptional regulator [Shewanella mangrovisoli]|uniref:TetR/AcrR family transcriptional regulator n=1 Tax=Shewanella mangrovisoli TaxID=2864211 RepID=A0ABV4VDZ0_9GAMM